VAGHAAHTAALSHQIRLPHATIGPVGLTSPVIKIINEILVEHPIGEGLFELVLAAVVHHIVDG
jgi:hypothetical protein